MAGFALTMASLVLTSAAAFRWPSMVLLLLTLAVVSLVMSIQAAQWTRTFRVRPEEVEAWWPMMSPLQRAGRVNEILKHDQSRILWSARQRRSYRLGILALLGGLAVALVPPVPATGTPGVSAVRWAAIFVGIAGFALELAWICVNALASKPMPKMSGPGAWAKQRSRRWLGMS